MMMRGKPSDADLQKGKDEIDRFVNSATPEELRTRHDWGSLQFELAEYAIRRCNDRLAEYGEDDA